MGYWSLPCMYLDTCDVTVLYQNFRCLWGNHDYLGGGVRYMSTPAGFERPGCCFRFSPFHSWNCKTTTYSRNKEREKAKHNLLWNCEMRHATKTANRDYLSKLQRNSLHTDSTYRQSGWLRPGVPARFSYLKLILICRVPTLFSDKGLWRTRGEEKRVFSYLHCSR